MQGQKGEPGEPGPDGAPGENGIDVSKQTDVCGRDNETGWERELQRRRERVHEMIKNKNASQKRNSERPNVKTA